MDFSDFLSKLRSGYDYGGQIAHIESLPAQEAQFTPFDDLHPVVAQALQKQGVTQLYTHQADAL